MKDKTILALLAPLSLLIASCATMALPEVSGYKMFTVPSSNYSLGEIIRIEPNPPREIVVDTPPIDDSNIRQSPGMAMVGSLASVTTGKLQGKLSGVAEGDAGGVTAKIVNFSYQNTKVIDIAEARLRDDLNAYFLNKPDDLKRYLAVSKRRLFGLLPPEEDLQVVTGLLVSDVVATIDRSTSAGANLTTNQLIDLLGGNFKHDSNSSDRVVGTALVVGFQSSSRLLRQVNK